VARVSRRRQGTFVQSEAYSKVWLRGNRGPNSRLLRGKAMFCNQCGKNIPDDANLCAYCGRSVGYHANVRRLIRPRAGRKIAGVCAGFASYFDLDVTLVRLVWLVIAFFGGSGFLAYVIGWILMPEEPMALGVPNGYPVTNQ